MGPRMREDTGPFRTCASCHNGGSPYARGHGEGGVMATRFLEGLGMA